MILMNVLEVTGDEIEDFHQRVLAVVSHLWFINGAHQTIDHSATATQHDGAKFHQ